MYEDEGSVSTSINYLRNYRRKKERWQKNNTEKTCKHCCWNEYIIFSSSFVSLSNVEILFFLTFDTTVHMTYIHVLHFYCKLQISFFFSWVVTAIVGQKMPASSFFMWSAAFKVESGLTVDRHCFVFFNCIFLIFFFVWIFNGLKIREKEKWRGGRVVCWRSA